MIQSLRYRWIIVAAGGLLGCVAFGVVFSLPVLLLPISKSTGWSVTGISAAMTIGFVSMAFGSIAWGSLSDRLGPRTVVLAGSVILATSLAAASRMSSLLGFQLFFGVGVGIAAAAIFAPMMACVTGWFDTHRSLAVSLVSAGMGMAPMTMAPLAAWLATNHDWRTTQLMIAAVAAAVMIPVTFLVRRPPTNNRGANVMSDPGGGLPPDMSVRQALRSPQTASRDSPACSGGSGSAFSGIDSAPSPYWSGACWSRRSQHSAMSSRETWPVSTRQPRSSASFTPG